MTDFIEPVTCNLRRHSFFVEIRPRKICEESFPRDRKTIDFSMWVAVLTVVPCIVIDFRFL
jgi:hypothetical protein